jgi:hypothetical protein
MYDLQTPIKSQSVAVHVLLSPSQYPRITFITETVRWYVLYCVCCSGDPPVCRILGMLLLWHQEKILERSELETRALDSSLDEDVLSNFETKHDRKAASRHDCLGQGITVRKEKNQNGALGSSSDEDVLCMPVMMGRSKLFWWGNYQNNVNESVLFCNCDDFV